MPGEWSVVMTGCARNMWRLSEVAELAFGRKGLDTFSLMLAPDRHLPAELSDGLTKEDADSIAGQLREIGTVVSVLRTEDVTGVRHRAREMWATKCTDHVCFTEIDNVISILGALNTAENILHLSPDATGWKKELSLNHIHVDFDGDTGDAVEKGQQKVEALKTALGQAYPDRGFTISHWLGDQVSFWQTTSDSPREAESGQELIFVEPVSSHPC